MTPQPRRSRTRSLARVSSWGVTVFKREVNIWNGGDGLGRDVLCFGLGAVGDGGGEVGTTVSSSVISPSSRLSSGVAPLAGMASGSSCVSGLSTGVLVLAGIGIGLLGDMKCRTRVHKGKISIRRRHASEIIM